MNTYSLLVNGIESGYYHGKNPYPCARKIFRNVSKKMNIDSFEFRIINIKNKRTYYYFGERKLNDSGKEYTFKYLDQVRVFKVKYLYKITRIYD